MDRLQGCCEVGLEGFQASSSRVHLLAVPRARSGECLIVTSSPKSLLLPTDASCSWHTCSITPRDTFTPSTRLLNHSCGKSTKSSPRSTFPPRSPSSTSPAFSLTSLLHPISSSTWAFSQGVHSVEHSLLSRVTSLSAPSLISCGTINPAWPPYSNGEEAMTVHTKWQTILNFSCVLDWPYDSVSSSQPRALVCLTRSPFPIHKSHPQPMSRPTLTRYSHRDYRTNSISTCARESSRPKS